MLVESNLEVSQQEAAKVEHPRALFERSLSPFEQDLAEIDSASVDISLFAADGTKQGHFLAPTTSPAAEAPKLGVNGRSTSHKAV